MIQINAELLICMVYDFQLEVSKTNKMKMKNNFITSDKYEHFLDIYHMKHTFQGRIIK